MLIGQKIASMSLIISLTAFSMLAHSSMLDDISEGFGDMVDDAKTMTGKAVDQIKETSSDIGEFVDEASDKAKASATGKTISRYAKKMGKKTKAMVKSASESIGEFSDDVSEYIEEKRQAD